MNNLNNKKTFKIIGIISICLIFILVILGIMAYLTTNVFKSDEEMFKQQFLQNIDVINNLTDLSVETEYRKLLKENNFNETTEVKLKYINNEGKEDNFIGNITGINNNETNISYKDIQINYGNTDVINMKYLKENNIYGIRFIEGTKFAVIDTSNDIKEVLKYFEIEDLINSGKINIDKLSLDVLNFSNEEIQQLENKYLSIILQDIMKENYSSQKNSVIKLENGENVTTNEYVLSLSVEQVKKIYKNILNQLSEDEIILGKLENVDNKIKEVGISLETDIKVYFVELLNKIIKNIDIQSGLIVKVYESQGTTLRTMIYYGDKIYELDIDNNYISIKECIDEKNTTISIKKENDILQINYKNYKNKEIEFTRKLNINNDNIKAVIDFKCVNNEKIKDLECSIDRNIKIGELDEIPTSFEKSGKVLLNDYDEKSTNKNLETLKNRIIKLMREKRDETDSILLDYIIQYNNKLEENEKTEEENKRKKFNSKFELYEGENQEENIVLNLLDEVSKNISNYKIINENEIKIYIEEGKENKELIKEIKSNFLKEEKNKYNIYFEYDSNARINEITIKVANPEEEQ